jgi:hypothetical protein
MEVDLVAQNTISTYLEKIEEIQKILHEQKNLRIPELVGRNNYDIQVLKTVSQRYNNLIKKSLPIVTNKVPIIQTGLDIKIHQIDTLLKDPSVTKKNINSITLYYEVYLDAINKIINDLQNMMFQYITGIKLNRDAYAELQPVHLFFKDAIIKIQDEYKKELDNYDNLEPKERKELLRDCINTMWVIYGYPKSKTNYHETITDEEYRNLDKRKFLDLVFENEIGALLQIYNKYKVDFIRKYRSTHYKNIVSRVKQGEVFNEYKSIPSANGVNTNESTTENIWSFEKALSTYEPPVQKKPASPPPAYMRPKLSLSSGKSPRLFQRTATNSPAAAGGGGGAASQQGGRNTKKQNKSAQYKTRRRK